MPFGPWEVVIILVILVVIFGASRLSQVGGAVGKSVREFRTAVDEQPAPAPVPPPAPVPTVPPVACPACQALNTPTNKFCSTCGATMAAASVAPAAVAGPQPVAGLAAVPETVELAAANAEPDESELAAIDRPPTPPKAVENTCPSCATVNPPRQPFCGQCGTRLTTAAA